MKIRLREEEFHQKWWQSRGSGLKSRNVSTSHKPGAHVMYHTLHYLPEQYHVHHPGELRSGISAARLLH